ncbi:MAG TPA: hypothetical protein VFE50_23520 [Cyclobacteriaceae bacterium]|nr:hypothetical protein [Cyclobacteriaceae bacterium]
MRAATLIIFILAVSASAFGQQRGTPRNSAAGMDPSERWFFGGGGSFNGGNHPYYGGKYTQFSVSPLVGYRITMPWAAGVQVTYQQLNLQSQKVKLSQYAVAPFTQYRFGKLFGYAEYQMISVPTVDNSSRTWYKRLPIGLGFTQPIGKRAAINAVALYDVLYNRATSVFGSPWVFRIYVTAGGVSF